jgi:hypothetical protein
MMETYPTERLYEEVAFISYHFNWSREEVMHLPHEERKRWCEEISAINDRMNQDLGDGAEDSGGMELTQEIDFNTSE